MLHLVISFLVFFGAIVVALGVLLAMRARGIDPVGRVAGLFGAPATGGAA